MVILPAVDIMGGKPVRLYKGDFSTAHQVANGALETALGFEKDGAEWIHMVDLDGSLQKKRVNAEVFLSVAQNTSLKVELGGGIRSMQDIEFYLSSGIERVILGSAALQQLDLVKTAVARFGGRIAVGIDAKNGYAAAEGWTQTSDVYFTDLAKSMEQCGVQTIIFTDISKDGTLTGPNLKQLEEINHAVSCDIIASGGITDIKDIKALQSLGLYGAICGKSIYSGSLDLKQALEVAANAE